MRICLKNTKIAPLCALFLFVAAVFSAVFAPTPVFAASYLTWEFPSAYFTNAAGVELSEADYRRAEDLLLALAMEAEEQFDPQREGSDVARLNAAEANRPVALSPITVRLIAAAKEAYALTEGAFNPALYPLVKLWGFSADNEGNYGVSRPEPSEESVTALLEKADFSALVLDEAAGTAVKTAAGLQVDFGGIAKGFLLDEWKAALERENVPVDNALLTLMSSTLLLGEKGGSAPYRIAVTDPRDRGNVALAVSAKNAFLSTSGDYERYYLYEGKRYCHILDATTGAPVQTGIQSATAVAPTGALSDAFATALCALSPKAANELCLRAGVRGVALAADGKYYVYGDLEVLESDRLSAAYSCPYDRGEVSTDRIISKEEKPQVWRYAVYLAGGILLAVALTMAFYPKVRALVARKPTAPIAAAEIPIAAAEIPTVTAEPSAEKEDQTSSEEDEA